MESRGAKRRSLARASALAAITVVLLAPALWNGFPFVWADTGGYLARPFDRTLEIGRSALYGAFIALGLRFDFWPAVVLQAAVTAWLLVLTLRAHGLGDRRPHAVALVLALALLTSLPWYVSTLMPDIFVPLAVLALHLLAFRRALLRGWEAAALIALTAFAIASHMAILALSAGLVVAFVVLRLSPPLRLPTPAIGAPSLALMAGIALALVSNLALTDRLTFTPGGAHFVFGRLLQDGIVGRYLADRCPDTTLRLCDYRDQLPVNADGWLWGGGDSPLYKLGGPDAYEPEARRIIADTLAMYPGRHLSTAAHAALQQLLMIRTGEGINPRDTEHAVRTLERLAPAVMPRFRVALQQEGAFDFTWINAIHLPVGFVAIGLLPVLIVCGWRRRIEQYAAALALTVLLALLANAAISGALSNPNDRYQSRIVWLAPLAVAVAGWQLRRARARA